MRVNPSPLLHHFIKEKTARSLSPQTIGFYREKLQYLCNHCNHFGLSILSLGRQDIHKLLIGLRCNPGGKHAYLRAWRAFYSWAEENGLISGNPCSRVRVRVPKPLRHAVQIEDIPRVLAGCATVRDKLIVSMLADTELRLSELSSISLSDMSLQTRTVKVWGKGAKERVVRYGPRTGALLDEYLHAAMTTDSLLELKPRGISIMLSRLGKATGVKCNAHSFRRTFATQSVRNGLNLFHIQSLLGHTTLAMIRLYAEQVGSEDAIEAYKPILT